MVIPQCKQYTANTPNNVDTSQNKCACCVKGTRQKSAHGVTPSVLFLRSKKSTETVHVCLPENVSMWSPRSTLLGMITMDHDSSEGFTCKLVNVTEVGHFVIIKKQGIKFYSF